VTVYLLSVLDSATDTGTSEEMGAILAFNEGLVRDGHWIFAGGLAEPDGAYVVDPQRAEPVAGLVLGSDSAYQSGLWLIRADSDDEARAMAEAGSRACARRVEVRRFSGVAERD
jgi:hypothetical protein